MFITQDQRDNPARAGRDASAGDVAHLAKAYGLKVTTHKPQVAYKETIRKPVHEHGRLKRQTGGHGQFADVKIEVAPRGAR